MKTSDVREALDHIEQADVDGADRGELQRFVAMSGRVRAWLDGFDVRCSRRSRDLATAGTSGGPQSDLANGGRRSGKESAAVADREAVCESMPSFEEALSSGAVSGGHVDAIARATRRLDDDQRAEFADLEAGLLAAAESERVEAFARRCREEATRLVSARAKSDAEELDEQRRRSSVKRWTDTTTGMRHTHLELDPLRDSAIWSAVDAQLASLRQADGNGSARTPWAQLQVDAWVAAVRARSGESAGPDGDARRSVDRVPEATVLIDHRTLVDGAHEHSVCELEDGTPIPLSTMRRLLCDCEVLPVVLGDKGEVLDEGRSRRTATRAQRRALRAMHRRCAHPECGVPFSACRIHHVRWWWANKGPTDIENLLPLCERHHHLVHEGGWTLTTTPDRVATWLLPDGSRFHQGGTIDRAPSGVGRRASPSAGPERGSGPARHSSTTSELEGSRGSGVRPPSTTSSRSARPGPAARERPPP